MIRKQVLSALNEKKAIIGRTGDDHWLYEPISEAIDLIEELEVYKKAYSKACIQLGVISNETGLCNATDIFCKKIERECEFCWGNYFLRKAREEE